MNGFIAVAFVAFRLGLRAAVGLVADERSRVFADLGLGLIAITIPIDLVSGALGATLVDVAGRSGPELATLFRLYDVLYNGLADVLEGAWIGAFSLAVLRGAMPSWIGWLGVVVGLSRWIKAVAPFAPLPDAVAAIGGLLFLVWFISIVAGLTRVALHSTPVRSRSTAPAGA